MSTSQSTGWQTKAVYSLEAFKGDQDYSTIDKLFYPGNWRARNVAGHSGTTTTKLTPKQQVYIGLADISQVGVYEQIVGSESAEEAAH